MLRAIENIEFSGICDDSRRIKKGDIFFAVKGARLNGMEFKDEAIRKGAAGVIECSREELARFSRDFYGRPSQKVRVIGITGTNGKTTVSYLLENIFRKSGHKTGVIGTIAHRWGANRIEAKNTTPGPIDLQRMLSEMAAAGIGYCAMEVSSHSLDQGRVLGIDFRSAIFTNLTGEHLDYHETLENYFGAKSRLFSGLSRDNLAVLNQDDESSGKIRGTTKARVLTYGIKNRADIFAEEIKFSLEGSEFLIRVNKGIKGKIRGKQNWFRVCSPMIGTHNVYNILAAATVALDEDIRPEVISEAVAEFEGAEGRLEMVRTDRGFNVFIDYAHTDNALENVLSALRSLAKGKLILVFGCGGDRDRLKRPRMGMVASRLSDYTIITSDNPRSEEPALIASEIKEGMDKAFKSYEVVLDRAEAIRRAIAHARPNDIILIAGKGHEKYQIIKEAMLPFSDKEAVLKVLGSK